MKKSKLLTSIAALALVLSVGACEVNVEVGDVDVGVDVNPNDSSEDTTEDETTTESTSEGTSPTESTSEGTSPSESSSEGGGAGEDEEAKKKAADLEEVKEAITGLGVDYFSSWEAYKYTFTGDYEEERLLTTKDNYTYGYSFDDDSKTYYVDGISYTSENGQYTKGTASSYIYTFNFSEDNYDAGEALDTISEATVDDIDEIKIDNETYTVTNTVVDDWGVLGCYTYENEYVIKISEGALVSVTINQTTTKEAGSIDTSAYTSTSKEAIEFVNPEDITLDVIKAAGFDEDLWNEKEPTELEIAEAILESVSEVNSLSELGAVHVEGYDDDLDETTTMDMTTDSNGDLYGVWEIYDSWYDTDTFYYYYQGVRYELEIDEDGDEERTTRDTYLGNLAGLLSDYDDALDAAPDKDEIEEGDFELTTSESGYELKVTVSGGYGYASWSADLTIKTDLEFNLTGIEYYQDEDYYYSVDQITYAQVSAAMSDFNIKDWLGYTPNSVTNMLADIEENSNYIMDIEYMLYESDYYYSQPSSVTLSLVWDYDTMLYASEDSCIIYYGYWYQYGFSYSFGVMDAELYLNNNGNTDVYVMDDDAYYTTDLHYSTTLNGLWQENIPNLTQLADYKGAFEINQTGNTSLGYTEGYAVDESAAEILNSICTCEGTSWLYDDYFKGYCRNYPLTADNLYYMYYYTAYDELQVYYRSSTYLYYGYLSDYTLVYWGERYDLSADIYNVGQVDNTSYVNSVLAHNA